MMAYTKWGRNARMVLENSSRRNQKTQRSGFARENIPYKSGNPQPGENREETSLMEKLSGVFYL